VKGALDLILAALPIALLILWMARKRAMPSNRALPLAALVLYALLLGSFAGALRMGSCQDIGHRAIGAGEARG
jgi:L-lactate permease